MTFTTAECNLFKHEDGTPEGYTKSFARNQWKAQTENNL
jgi:hypothetical protein